MAENEIAITFEVLFELLRREKNRDELQELSPTIYMDLQQYVSEKTALKVRFDQAGNHMDAEKVSIQINNTEKLFAELNDRREKKILTLALYQSKSRHTKIQTKNMLPPEKELFTKVLELLMARKKAIATSRKEDIPEPQGIKSSGSQKVAHPEEQQPPSELPISADTDERTGDAGKEGSAGDALAAAAAAGKAAVVTTESAEGAERKDAKEVPGSEGPLLSLELLMDVPGFMGPEMDTYGPYALGQQVSLPLPIAELLLARGKAKRVEKSRSGPP
ncbi:MAG: DNA replication complex GINS family protein [DPANN group archaeon]|nr:DNA replication complex GINS family protein [DPANN group archaeon]